MGDTQSRKPATKRSLSFVFVHSDDGPRQFPMLTQPEPWLLRFRKWMQYHGIQLRWDIERRLARLFKRRWGGWAHGAD